MAGRQAWSGTGCARTIDATWSSAFKSISSSMRSRGKYVSSGGVGTGAAAGLGSGCTCITVPAASANAASAAAVAPSTGGW